MKKLKLIALCAAVLAGLGIYYVLREAAKPTEVPRTSIVVAAVDIPENTLITEEMLTLTPVATEAVLNGALRDVRSAVGMVMASDVYAGEQLTSYRLVRVGENDASHSTLAYKVEPGMRAVTISVNQISSSAFLLRPGNRVDVVLSFSHEEEEKKPDGSIETKEITQTELLLENLEILAVGSVLSRDGSTEYGTVTLQTDPEDAVLLTHAEFNGSLRLLLRSALDQDETGPVVVGIEDLLEAQEGTP